MLPMTSQAKVLWNLKPHIYRNSTVIFYQGWKNCQGSCCSAVTDLTQTNTKSNCYWQILWITSPWNLVLKNSVLYIKPMVRQQWENVCIITFCIDFETKISMIKNKWKSCKLHTRQGSNFMALLTTELCACDRHSSLTGQATKFCASC